MMIKYSALIEKIEDIFNALARMPLIVETADLTKRDRSDILFCF